MERIASDLPDELAAELRRRAAAEMRSVASLVRLAVRELLFGGLDGAVIGQGWAIEEDWRGTWAVREKPGHPGVVERVRLEDGPAAVEERPLASMELRE